MITEAGERSNRDGTNPDRETSIHKESSTVVKKPNVEKRGRRGYT
jgi:hypothetical protein